MTTGYREGLGVGKARVMQGGFDTGYPIGVLIGLRAGRVLGVLEGLVAAGASKEGVDEGLKGELGRLMERARRELERGALLEGLDEEVVMRAERVPERVEAALGRWEGLALGREGLGAGVGHMDENGK